MIWCLLEERWLRDGHHVYFAPEDTDGIAAFESHLRERNVFFVVENRPEVPAVVFSDPTHSARARQRTNVHQRSAA